MPDGVAVFDRAGNVALWNAAAEAITGFSSEELPASSLPSDLDDLLRDKGQAQKPFAGGTKRGTQFRTHHKLGHAVTVIARQLTLRDSMGEVLGRVVLFHPAERIDALPGGDDGAEQKSPANQIEFEERLNLEFEDFLDGVQPLGLMRVTVDQNHALRKTHGAAACQAMIEKVLHALASGLRPTEELGRWGEDDFLILAHERSPEMLARHAVKLAGLARTADFRWWGDRISLTVSIGAAQAQRSVPLAELLERTRKAMEASMRQGGNRVTCAPRDKEDDSSAEGELICTPS